MSDGREKPPLTIPAIRCPDCGQMDRFRCNGSHQDFGHLRQRNYICGACGRKFVVFVKRDWVSVTVR